MKGLTTEDLFQEVCRLAEEQGAVTQETWNDLVDEVLQGHVDLGRLDADQDIEGFKNELESRFTEYVEEIAGDPGAQDNWGGDGEEV